MLDLCIFVANLSFMLVPRLETHKHFQKHFQKSNDLLFRLVGVEVYESYTSHLVYLGPNCKMYLINKIDLSKNSNIFEVGPQQCFPK